MNHSPNPNLSRRGMLVGASAVAGLAYAGMAGAASAVHDHSKHATGQPDVLQATMDCLDKGRRCMSHCLVSFGEGDTELAACAISVQDMLAVCDGFATLVAGNSKFSEDYAKVCAAVCKDCAQECRKHDKHHECRHCAEACEELLDQIALAW